MRHDFEDASITTWNFTLNEGLNIAALSAVYPLFYLTLIGTNTYYCMRR